MASEIKLIAQPRSGGGAAKTFDYKPGDKHSAEANNFYKILVDGKEELPAGTKIARKGNSVVFDFPDGTKFEIEDWCTVSDSRLTELVNGEAYSAADSAYVTAKDIDSGTCVIWADAGQAGAVLGDSSAAPVNTTATTAAAGGDDHSGAAIIGALLGIGALAALSHSGSGGSSDSGPKAGTPAAVNEDFAPIKINTTTINASDDGGQGNIQIISAKIKSADGFNVVIDDVASNDGNDDVRIVLDGSGVPTLQLTDSGANKFGTVVTSIQMKDGAGNVTTQDVIFTVNAVNDAPLNALDGAPFSSTSVRIADHGFGVKTVSNLNGLALSVSDVDNSPGLESHKIDHVVITTDDGILSVSALSGLSAGAVTGNNSGTLTLTETQENINLLLDTIVWHDQTLNSLRDVKLTMTTTDKGELTAINEIVIPVIADGAFAGGDGGVIFASDLLSGGTIGRANTAAVHTSSVSSLVGDLHDQVPSSA